MYYCTCDTEEHKHITHLKYGGGEKLWNIYLIKKRNINAYNNNYIGESFVHDSLYYLIEIINVSPIKLNECKYINDEYVNRSLLFKNNAYIKLNENYSISNILTDCYKNNFRMKFF